MTDHPWNRPSGTLAKRVCLASSCGIERHVCGNGHCLKKLSEQHHQLAEINGRFVWPHGLRNTRKKTRLWESHTSRWEGSDLCRVEMGDNGSIKQRKETPNIGSAEY